MDIKRAIKDKNNIIKALWIVAFAPVALIFLMLLLAATGLFGRIPSFEELENPKSNLATEIYGEDGHVIGTFFVQNRSYVQYAELFPQDSSLILTLDGYHVPPVVAALIATEDVRFRNHSGIDIPSLFRVGIKTVMLQRHSQGGGSTITQQLAKNLFPRDTASNRSKVGRTFKLVQSKFKEWITALKLEHNYTKEEIAAMYLNTVAYGSNAYGIKSAASTFFGKTPDELNIQEAAVLVGVVTAPTRYSPVRNYDNSLARRNLVLDRMRAAGAITRKQCDSLSALPITLNYQPISHNEGEATYFREMLRQVMTMQRPTRRQFLNDWDYEQAVKQYDENPIYGWCLKNTKADGSGTPYKPGDEIDLTADMTLYAMWEANPARILFDPNAKNTTGDTKGIDTVYDADVTLTPNGYERPGYTFTGWNTKPDNTGAGYADKAEYHVTGDVTMYAQWKADKASLVYNANGGTGSMDSLTGVTDQKVAVNENGFTYKGHRFSGWNSMPDGTGDTYNPGDEYTLPAGVGVLYAQWEEIPASLTYEGNGSDVTGETAGYTGLAEDTPVISENGFDRPGHEFKGWNTKPDGTGDTLQPGDTMTPLAEGDTILYAQWDELPATVTYDPNGGTGATSPYNGLVGDAPQAADNGFAAPDDCKTFAGWNTKADGTGDTIQPGDELPSLTDDITLYAQWDDTGCKTEGLAQTGVGLSGVLTVVGLMLTVGGLATVMQRKRA